MIAHISDRTLDGLLDGSLDDVEERAIEVHARRCDRCATRLREWQVLFPQLKRLTPVAEPADFPPRAPVQAVSAEHSAVAPTARASSMDVFIPDWTPAPSGRSFPTRIAWAVVVVLVVVAGYLLFRGRESNATVVFGQEGYEELGSSLDSTGMGSGIRLPEAVAQPANYSPPEDTAGRPPERLPPPPVESAASVPADPKPREVDLRESAKQPPAEVAARRPVPGRDSIAHFPSRTESPREQPLATEGFPREFQRVTLSEAAGQLAGEVRLITGLTPEIVQLASGAILPGADPDRAVVRVVYNAPEGRVILDQQRVGRPGRREPDIAISTAPNGVSVAQWVDWGGYWISLAGRTDQQTLLALANRIR